MAKRNKASYPIFGGATYNGLDQDLRNSSYWSNWQTGAYTVHYPDPDDNPHEAGTYYVQFWLNSGWEWEDGSEADYFATAWIDRLLITPPSFTGGSTIVYDGTPHYPPDYTSYPQYYFDNGLLVINGETDPETDVKTEGGPYYSIDFEITELETDNICWSDATSAHHNNPRTLNWEIIPATLITTPTAKYIEYTGNEINVSQNLRTYWNDWTETYGEVQGIQKKATNAGTYNVRLQCNPNYQFSSSISASSDHFDTTWTISPKPITPPSWKANVPYTGSEYNVNNTSYWNNWNQTQCTISGETAQTNAGSYEVFFTCTQNYSFNGAPEVTRSWTITRAVISPPTWSAEINYTGTAYSVDDPIYWSGWDINQATIISGYIGTNAGTYTAVFRCTGNYTYSGGLEASRDWIIDPYAVRLPTWRDGTTNVKWYSYNWGIDIDPPSYTYENHSSVDPYHSPGTSPQSLTGSYDITFVLESSNYKWTDNTTGSKVLTWGIEPLTISTTPTWIANSLTYNGSAQSAAVTSYWTWTYDINDSTKFTQITSSTSTWSGTNAGNYSASIGIASAHQGSVYFNGSYTTATVTWSINKRSVTIPTWSGSHTYEYNGNAQGAPAYSSPDSSYINTSGDTSSKTNVGTYTITFALKSTSNTYWNDASHTTTNKTLQWTITKKSIPIPTWTSTDTFTYDGTTQGPPSYSSTYASYFTASGDTAGKINAATYTITFSLKSTTNTQWSDNTITNKNLGWSIESAPWDFDNLDLRDRTSTDWTSFVFVGSLHPAVNTITMTLSTENYIEVQTTASACQAKRKGSYDGSAHSTTVTFTTTDTNFDPTVTATVRSAIWDDQTAKWTVSPNSLALKMHGADASKDINITKNGDTFLTYSVIKSGSAININFVDPTITVTSVSVTNSAFVAISTNEYNQNYRYRPAKQINVSVTVSNNQVSAPEWRTNCVYDTFEFNTASSTYWTNWDTTYFTYVAADFKKTNAGTYPVTFTCKAGYEFTNEGSTADRNWIIEKAKVTKPSISGTSAFTYNWGAALGPVTVVADLDKVDITGDTGTKTVVGTYTIVGALHDANNYQWTDGTSANVSLQWNVVQLILTPPSAQSGTLTYNGSVQSPSWDVTIDSHVSISGNSQTNAGSYTATFTIPTRYDTNATWSTGVSSVTCGWSIGKKSWSTNNNSDMTYYDISSIDLSVLLNDTYARDGFTAARTSGDDCVNISGTTISRKGSYTGSSKTATLTITANGNYTPSTKTCTVTIAIWQEGSWSITPTVLNTVPNSTLSNAITINNYFSTMAYEITPGSLTVTRSGNKLTIKTPASANSYTGKISNDDFMDTSTFTHYASVEKSFTVHSYTIVNSPNWKNNNPEWTGNTITVSGTTYWDTWDTTKYTVSGNSASTVGSHTATFTANSSYWLDSVGTTSVNKTWYIATQKVPLPYWNSGAPSKTYNWGATISVADSEYTYDSRCNRGGQTSGTAVGTYAITFTLKNTTNYEWVTGGTAIKSLEWNIVTLRIVQPELAAAVIFNNTEQTATWTPTYSTTRVTAGGQLKGTLGGKYTATFTINSSYYPNAKWEDAETAQISVDWYIDKLGLASPTTSSLLVYNGDFQSPTWSQSSDVTAYTTNNDEAKTDAGNYSTTWTIKSNFTTSVYWETTSGLTLTINWSIAKKSNWGVVDNDDLTDYGVNSIDLQTIFTGVYARDLSEFTFAYSAASGYNDCVTFDIQGQVIKTKSSVPLGSAQTGRYLVTPNSNYTATPVKNVLISAARWKTDGTWNVDPNSFNTVPNTEYYALITPYNSNLTYTLNKSSLSLFTRTDDQLTLTTSSTLGTYTATISTAAYNDKTIYTHYNAITRSISINCRNIITSPTWKNNNPQWTGQAIDVSGTTYWNDWNTNLDTSGLSATTVDSHTATFSVHAGDNYWLDTVGTTSVNRTWYIVKRIVNLPHLTAAYSDKIYNWGSTITIGTNEYEYDETYSLEGSDTQTSGTEVGTYGLTFVLIDTSTCVWNDAQQTTTKKIVEWHINPLILTKPTQNGSLTYNGASQTPQWNDFPSSAHVTTEGSATGTNAGSYTLTFKINPAYTGAGWDTNLTKDYTATWTIGRKTWSTANNTSMTARTTNAVGYGILLNNSVYSRDFADFTFVLKSGSPDYTDVDTTNSQITKDTSKPWDGASKVDTYVITPNSNYVSGTKEVTVTVAIWKTETWSLSKTSVTIIGTNADTVTINNYSSNIPSSNWTLTPTPSSNAPFSYARLGQTITITGVSTGNGSLKVTSAAYEYTTSFIYYDAHNETITITINAKLDPTWTVSKNLLECTYAPSGTVTDTATVNDIQSGITISVNSSAVPSGQGSVSYTNATITYTAAFGSSYYESQKNVVVSSAATATYNAKSVTIKVVNHRATQPLMTVSPWESSVSVQVDSTVNAQTIPTAPEGSYTVTTSSYYTTNITGGKLKVTGVKGTNGQTCTVSIAQTTNYNAASRSFTVIVTKKAQTWTISNVALRQGESTTVTLTGNISSGQRHTSTNPTGVAVVTLSDVVITILATGSTGSSTTYTITIDGDDYYESRTQSATIIVDLTKYVRIWSNGAWHRAIPYIYYKSNNEQNARWHKTEAYVYNNNAWKITRS